MTQELREQYDFIVVGGGIGDRDPAFEFCQTD